MYGVISDWGELSITWYDTLSEAFSAATKGDTVIKRIEELK